MKILVFSYISLLTLLPPLQFSILIYQKTAIDRAKILSPLVFINFFWKETALPKKNFQPFCPERKKCHFWGRSPKSVKFKKCLYPSFFVKSGSTIAQINRVDERNWMVFLDFWYLEKQIFCYIFAIYWRPFWKMARNHHRGSFFSKKNARFGFSTKFCHRKTVYLKFDPDLPTPIFIYR